MFEHLTKYKRILVTGPQRSGTTIAAKMIAADTGYRFVDEHEFGVDDICHFEEMLAIDGIVIQCPAMCHLIHKYGRTSENLIVFMIRRNEDIIASENRIRWHFAEYERSKYKNQFESVWNFYQYLPICEIKKQVFIMHQEQEIKEHMRIGYSELSNHRLWIDKQFRLNFTAKQTEVAQ